MRIAIVHGYFLGDSGSAIYVRELARELARQGHDVTLVCQEQDPSRFGFIDSFYEFTRDNRELVTRFEKRAEGPGGRCRLVRPDLGGKLLTYVAGPFPGYDAVPFQQASASRIDAYLEKNETALSSIFDTWPQDFVQANHAVMQPYLVGRALEGRAPYFVTIHGSALNFSVKEDPRLVPYALDGLGGAAAVGTLSETSRQEVVDFCLSHGLDIGDRLRLLPPGVDSALMAPPEDRRRALGDISDAIDPVRDDIAVFAGRLLWTKGAQYAVAAMPLMLAARPSLRLVIVGDGPMEEPLCELIGALDAGDIDAARELTREREELRGSDEFGPVIPALDEDEEEKYAQAARGNIGGRMHLTGHLDHARLAPVFGAADLSLAVSVFSEAFALVSIEALSAGAIPVATYHSGLRCALDTVADELGDESLKRLKPGVGLTRALAVMVPKVLKRYPTREAGFRRRLHELAARRFSWEAVAERYLQLAREAGVRG